MECINIITVLAALEKYNSQNFSGDRKEWAMHFIKNAEKEMDQIIGLCEEQEVKYSNNALWDVVKKMTGEEGISLKILLRKMHNHSVNLDNLYLSMNKALNDEIPLVYFNRFVSQYLQPKADRYVKVIAEKRSQAERNLEDAKQELKDAMYEESRFMEF